MLCGCDIEGKGFVIVVYFKMAPQRESRVKVSVLLRARHKVSEVANLVGVPRPTVYTSKKRMDDGERVNRRVGSCRKTVTIHNSLSTSAICWPLCHRLYAFLDCVDDWAWHPDDLTHFESRTKKCRNLHLIVSLQSHFKIHNNNKSFSSMSQSQSIGWIKQKSDNNCKTIRISIKTGVINDYLYGVKF